MKSNIKIYFVYIKKLSYTNLPEKILAFCTRASCSSSKPLRTTQVMLNICIE